MNKPALLDKPLYTASATADGGRSGKVRTRDGAIELDLALPKELGGNGRGANPEQLFASGYAACFGTGLATVAAHRNVNTGPVSISVDVTIGEVGPGFGLAVELTARLPELPRETAEALVQATHQVCPYSLATRGNIVVNLHVEAA